MKYANTVIINGVETIITILPIDIVPGFDPENPPQANTYSVDEMVQVGWIKVNGSFVAPPPAPPAPAVVPTVSALQGLIAIDQAGLAEEYDAWASSPSRTFVQRAFINKAMTWRRDDPTIAAASSALGLTNEQVDQLFATAATL